ncbi:MAG TPA: aminopeptidase P family N-terminal domain-containing protein, partial [Thermodesulfobacteriota bacterium]|nr:aminopeptidase P family N-terminal domain-containing protein [Thermodesulfobacteriota bacterium]
MNHDEWMRGSFKRLSSSLGFHFVPTEEIERRLRRIRTAMEKNEIETLLVIEKMDYYYLSGTTQDGLLFVPLQGRPLLLIRRELERAKIESPLEDVISLKSNRELPSFIQTHLGKLPKILGLELDVLPVKDYFRYQELFKGSKLKDASSILRDTRKLKSPFEISLMRVAGEIGRKVYQEGKKILREGMTEIEFGGLL